jgi:hypothetical protein
VIYPLPGGGPVDSVRTSDDNFRIARAGLKLIALRYQITPRRSMSYMLLEIGSGYLAINGVIEACLE